MAAAHCFSRRAAGHEYDHAAVVVLTRLGEVMVLEHTLDGVKLRPYDERISMSQSRRIVAQKLDLKRTNEMHAAAREYATRVTEPGAEDKPGARTFVPPDSALASAVGGTHSPDVDVVVGVWQAMGIAREDAPTAPTAQQVNDQTQSFLQPRARAVGELVIRAVGTRR